MGVGAAKDTSEPLFSLVAPFLGLQWIQVLLQTPWRERALPLKSSDVMNFINGSIPKLD